MSTEPTSAYATATTKSSELIDQSTPAKAMIVKVPFSSMSRNEIVVAVKLRASSTIR